tara:strand:+ start:276 stop:1328 length:1053 start_codon:yes stop_codon:yes gene_type:complete
MSFVTVLGILFGFGSVDSLAKSSEDSFATFYKYKQRFIPLLLVSILLIFLNFKIMNIFLSSLYFGTSFWFLGEIRRKSILVYELIISFYMLIFWICYLPLVAIETSTYQNLTMLFYLASILCLVFSIKVKTNEIQDDLNKKDFMQVSYAKLGWEITYSLWTRNAFIFWSSFHFIPPVLSYFYYISELFSAIISHYQSIFIKSNEISRNIKIFFKIIIVLLVLYVVLFSSLILIFNYREYIISLVENYIYIDQSIKEILYFDYSALLLCLIIGTNIFAIQIVAYGRYAYHLYDNLRLVYIFGILLLLNVIISIAFLFSLNIIGLIISNLFMIASVIIGIMYIINFNQNKTV